MNSSHLIEEDAVSAKIPFTSTGGAPFWKVAADIRRGGHDEGLAKKTDVRVPIEMMDTDIELKEIPIKVDLNSGLCYGIKGKALGL